MTRRSVVVLVVALVGVAAAAAIGLSRRGDGGGEEPTTGRATRWVTTSGAAGVRTTLLSTSATPEDCGAGCPFERVVAGPEGREAIVSLLALVGDGIENLSTQDEATADAKRALARAHRALDVRLRQAEGGPPLRALVVARSGAAAEAVDGRDHVAVLFFDHAHPSLDARRAPGTGTGWRLLVARHVGRDGKAVGTLEVAEPVADARLPETAGTQPNYARRLGGPAREIVPAPEGAVLRRFGIALRPDGRVSAYGGSRESREAVYESLVSAIERLLSGL
jgi:hypothetical protein